MKITEVTATTQQLINEAVAQGEITPVQGATLQALNNPGKWSKGMTLEESLAEDARVLGALLHGQD